MKLFVLLLNLIIIRGNDELLKKLIEIIGINITK
jgi:hypothetical protein